MWVTPPSPSRIRVRSSSICVSEALEQTAPLPEEHRDAAGAANPRRVSERTAPTRSARSPTEPHFAGPPMLEEGRAPGGGDRDARGAWDRARLGGAGAGLPWDALPGPPRPLFRGAAGYRRRNRLLEDAQRLDGQGDVIGRVATRSPEGGRRRVRREGVSRGTWPRAAPAFASTCETPGGAHVGASLRRFGARAARRPVGSPRGRVGGAPSTGATRDFLPLDTRSVGLTGSRER